MEGIQIFNGLTLTLDPAIRHTVVHHSSTSTCTPNFIQIEETFCGRTAGRTDVRTDIFPPLILLVEVDLIMNGDITLEALRRCQRASKVISPFIIFAVFDVSFRRYKL